MKVLVIIATTLCLAIVTAASQQLLCRANEGSVLNFLAGNSRHGIDCVGSSPQFAISKDQYDNMIMRLETLEKALMIRTAQESETTQETPTTQTIEATNIPSSTVTLPPKLLTWTRSGNMSYKYFPRDKVNYITAEKRCKSHGGRLASTVLRDPNVVSDLAQAGFIVYNDYWLWIGFDDRRREGQWVWSDGGTMNAQTTAWIPYEPNSFQGANEDCGSVRHVSKGKLLLNDVSCWITLPYICEAETPVA